MPETSARDVLKEAEGDSPAHANGKYPLIEHHAAIGDMRTLALVDIEGSIGFLCYPEFDSPTVFAKILDRERGGSFCIKPELAHHRVRQLYLPDTNVVMTRFLHDEGIAELTDFMPIGKVTDKSRIVRVVTTVRGNISIDAICDPRFDYGRCGHKAEMSGRAVLFKPDNPDFGLLRLRASVPLEIVDGAVRARFQLSAGKRAVFVLDSGADAGTSAATSSDADGADAKTSAATSSDADADSLFSEIDPQFDATVSYWQSWMKKSRYGGRWREMVDRSALALKLLTSRAHGSLLAAPTFSLPELIGGERNWDYRFTWLRDSSFTIYAFIRLGFTDEALAFQNWLHERVSDDSEHGPLQPMYRIDGSKNLHETTLEHLDGYMGSKPVRIGNAAHHQLQLDIYGELMDAIYLSSKYGAPMDFDAWRDVQRVVEWVSLHWKDPDEGIWEVRSGRQCFLHSRVMCWVALDRAVRLALKRSLPGPLGKWGATRDEIYEDIFKNYWNEEKKAFVRIKGGDSVDASSLLMPLMRFISPTDPRWLSTLAEIGRTLVEEPLVYRYDTARDADGLRGGEGSFTACSFWYIECLARAGEVAKARLLFEKMLGYANHVGLFAEETGTNGQHLGNFPQAFTHLALISAAVALDRALDDKESSATWR